MQFTLQNRMLQLDGIMGMLMNTRFDPSIEQYYYQMGQNSVAVSLDFNAFLKQAGSSQFKLNWAKQGLVSLLYSKSADNMPPYLISGELSEKKCEEALNALKPYMGIMSPQEHIAVLKSIMAQTGAQTFADCLVPAIKNIQACSEASSRYLAINYLLDTGLVLARRPVYTSSGVLSKYEDCYYTRNMTIIATLANSGAFSDSQDSTKRAKENLDKVNAFHKAIYSFGTDFFGAKTFKGLETQTFAVAKIVPSKLVNETCTYTMTIPTTPVDLLSGDVKIIPASLMYQFCEGLTYRLTQEKITGISCGNSLQPDYETKITVIPDILRQVYSGCSNPAIVADRANKPVGYSLRRCSYIAYNLESSILSGTGYAKINPFDIKAVRALGLKDINTTAHELSASAILQYFLQHADFSSQQACERILMEIPEFRAYIRTANYTSVDVQSAAAYVHYTKLLAYMQNHPERFANYITEIKKLSTQVNAHKIMLSGDKVKQISELLNESLLVITYKSSDGTLSEFRTTNNTGILAKTLGKDYAIRYESNAVKLRCLKDLIIKNNIRDKQTIQNILIKYKLSKINLDLLPANFSNTDVTNWVENAISNLPVRNTTPNPDVILFRVCDLAQAERGYWKNINVNNITSVAVCDN